MKTITALLMMTSAAGAQLACTPGACPPTCTATSCQTGGTFTPIIVPPDQPYTLVLRDKRGHTMLIRDVDACVGMASYLKASPDIESAECFK
jgi:hypothetical protein